jgi:hypothetical protein
MSTEDGDVFRDRDEIVEDLRELCQATEEQRRLLDDLLEALDNGAPLATISDAYNGFPVAEWERDQYDPEKDYGVDEGALGEFLEGEDGGE